MSTPRRSPVIATLAAALCAPWCGCHTAADTGSPTEPPTKPILIDSVVDEYARLSQDIAEYHGEPPRMNAWTLNAEHLFLGTDDPFEPGSLRQRAIRFSRRPGALDMLFTKLASPDASANTLLTITEILVFYGQYHLAGDEMIAAPAAADADRLLKSGAFAYLDKRFDAPVQRMLSYAINKAVHRTPHRPTEESWAK
jgi:hypothetical protein